MFEQPVWRSSACVVLLMIAAVLPATAGASPRDEADRLLDRFHAAAAKAQFTEYFALFAPEGVFIGTDASERWTVAQFKRYAKPHFDQGKGWTYRTLERNITVAADGNHASFDELLDNASLGRCRGTGVLRRIDGQWRVEQYHLTIPVPNELALEFVKRIREGQKAEPSKPAAPGRQ